MTLHDSLELAQISNRLDGLVEWAYQIDGEPDDYRGEQEAEMAWLRAAENAGWEEALYESYIESGLIARPW